MVLLLWHRPNIFRHVDFMSCHGFSALGTRPLLGPPIPKRLQWFRLTDQKLGNVFDAKRKNGDGLGLSPNACVGGYLGLRPSVQSMSNILNLFPGFSLFLPGNEVMGFSEPNLWYTLVVYHLHGQTGQFHLPENGREGLKLVSKNGTRISVCNIPAGKTGAFQMFRCSRKFSVG